jgi:transglutaminase-like putative cysteine protease
MVRRFRFVPDPKGVELLKSPGVMLNEWRLQGFAKGDCDDAAILSASIALAMGLRVRWVVLGFTPGGPYRHVYAEACDGRGWVDFDVTRPMQFPPGLRIYRRLNVPVTP